MHHNDRGWHREPEVPRHYPILVSSKSSARNLGPCGSVTPQSGLVKAESRSQYYTTPILRRYDSHAESDLNGHKNEVARIIKSIKEAE